MITLPGIEGQKFAVLGLGKTGMATAASLKASKAHVFVWDDNSDTRAAALRAGYEVADLTQEDLKGFSALLLSPGIPHTHPKPHPVVERFRNWRGGTPLPLAGGAGGGPKDDAISSSDSEFHRLSPPLAPPASGRGTDCSFGSGIPIIGDIELLFRACPEATFIGITGTNGKSTTTALIGHILATAGRKVQIGGNLGTPVLSFDPLGKNGIYVLELSSYQLELIQNNRLNVAVFLNVTPDHIDRHGDMAGYIAAKARIFETDTPLTLVIGTDEPETRFLAMQARQKKNIRIEEISVTHPVAQGVMTAGQQMFAYTGEEEGGLVANLTAFKALPGKHNAQNACAAFAACRAVGVLVKEIVEGLKTFPGLAHRQQLVAEIDDVRFINDSKATNADAAGKALACYDNIYWIIGGRPKAGGLSGLEEFAPRIRHAFIIGEAAEAFGQWCEGKMPYTQCGTLDVAVEKAAATAWKEKKTGAVVLLSPACASWDQFTGFEERGRVFGELVRTLSTATDHKVATR